MTTNKEKILINVVLAVFIAGIICCFTLYPILCDTVSAEELTSNSVLDFNQLFNVPRNFNITSTSTDRTQHFASSLTTFDPSHKYFIGNTSSLSTVFLTIVRYNNGSYVSYTDFSTDSIYYNNGNYNQVVYQINTQGVANGSFNFMVVDLTQCFGSGNEPSTVEEFKSYFGNDYYAYTTSTLISLDTLQSYNNGVADTLNSYKYVVTANDSYNNLVPYGKDTEMTRGIDSKGRYYNSFNNSVNEDNPKYAYFGFSGGSLSSGSKLTLTGYCLQGQTSPEGVDVAVLVGSNFVNVGHLIASRESWKYNTITFSLPYASSGIYFIGLGYGYFELSDFVIEIETTDFNTLYSLAYKAGQNSRDTDVSVAYDNGYRNGLADSNPYTFNALFGAVFDAPIQALTGLLDFDILGVNMKGLYLSLFTLALIIFVVKLCLGKV